MNVNDKYEEYFRGSSILITGATGFIGSLLVNYFLSLNSRFCCNIKLMLMVRDMQKANRMFNDNAIDYIEIDLTELPLRLSEIEQKYNPPDLIFHCAAVTKSEEIVSSPIETADGILFGTKGMLELANRWKIKSMVYVSSMEIYGCIKRGKLRISEEEQGRLDLFSVRSCYPLAKRMAEHYCYCYWYKYQTPVKIARLAQTFGKGAPHDGKKIFSQLANSVNTGDNIILHTKGNSFGNYVDSEEAIEALLLLSLKGESGEAYNVVNEKNTMRIRDMAKIVARNVARGRIKVTIEPDEQQQQTYAPDTKLRMSAEKLRKLGWEAKVDIENMYRNMMK